MSCSRHHTDSEHHEGDTTNILAQALTDHDRAPETHESVAAKLRRVGYRAPDIRPIPQYECVTRGCKSISYEPGPCEDCRNESSGRPMTNAEKWELTLVLSLVVVLVAVVGSFAYLWVTR